MTDFNRRQRERTGAGQQHQEEQHQQQQHEEVQPRVTIPPFVSLSTSSSSMPTSWSERQPSRRKAKATKMGSFVLYSGCLLLQLQLLLLQFPSFCDCFVPVSIVGSPAHVPKRTLAITMIHLPSTKSSTTTTTLSRCTARRKKPSSSSRATTKPSTTTSTEISMVYDHDLRDPDMVEILMAGAVRYENVPLPDSMMDTTLFVGNLCEFVQDGDLSEQFRSVTNLRSLPAVVARNPNNQSLRYGFVAFPTVEEKEVSE